MHNRPPPPTKCAPIFAQLNHVPRRLELCANAFGRPGLVRRATTTSIRGSGHGHGHDQIARCMQVFDNVQIVLPAACGVGGWGGRVCVLACCVALLCVGNLCSQVFFVYPKARNCCHTQTHTNTRTNGIDIKCKCIGMRCIASEQRQTCANSRCHQRERDRLTRRAHKHTHSTIMR